MATVDLAVPARPISPAALVCPTVCVAALAWAGVRVIGLAAFYAELNSRPLDTTPRQGHPGLCFRLLFFLPAQLPTRPCTTFLCGCQVAFFPHKEYACRQAPHLKCAAWVVVGQTLHDAPVSLWVQLVRVLSCKQIPSFAKRLQLQRGKPGPVPHSSYG